MRSIILQTTASLLFAFSMTIGANAQDGILRMGDQAFEDFGYAQAVELYEQAFKKGAKSIPHARRLAESYWNMRQPKGAEEWYAIVAASSQAQPLDVYRYAELLRASGKYEDSDTWLKRYAKIVPQDNRSRNKENAKVRLAELLSTDPITNKVTPAPINSDRPDLAPFVFGDTIYFSSSRQPQYMAQRLDPWNDQPFLNLYSAHLSADGSIRSIAPVRTDVNTSYHESNLVISADGKEMYFTRNNFTDGRKKLSADGVNNLQIFHRRKRGDTWAPVESFAFNSAAYSTGHPALSADGQRLYFTSDKPGGVGGKDLYVCLRSPHGGWGAPNNLGPDINTEGDEMFPYVRDNSLYFASDGHLGLGGLDLFRTTVREKSYGPVENLNAPLNSPADDFALCLTADGERGYFTTDRNALAQGEDIYQFTIARHVEEERKWIGRVLDQNDALPLAHLPVRLLDADRNELARTITRKNGSYEFTAPTVPAMVSAEIPGGATGEIRSDEIALATFGDTELPDLYLDGVMDLPVNAIITDANTGLPLADVSVTVKDNRDGSILFVGRTDANGISQGQIADRRFGEDMNFEVSFARDGYFKKVVFVDFRVLMYLEHALTGPEGSSLTPVSSGVDLAKAMNLRPIYFDFREAKIRTDAMGELDLVAEVMRVDPTIRIDLRSHTDSRASAEYNMHLSQRRSDSARAYLVEQGIAASRITAHGFGESQLVNQCADGVECSEEEHQLNRRTAFIVVGCDNCDLGATTPR